MVSSVKFHAFKDLTLVREKPFSSTVAFVLMLALIATAPFVVPFLICAAYVISGPILTVVLHLRNRRSKQEPAVVSETTEPEPAAAESNSGA